MSRVLFICIGNQGRSVMAERLFNSLAGGAHTASSAGWEPGREPHPVVVEALREVGIDASDHVPRKLDLDSVGQYDVVVSVCGEEGCPVTPPEIRRISWSIEDPMGRPIERVRPIRDDLQRRVQELVDAL